MAFLYILNVYELFVNFSKLRYNQGNNYHIEYNGKKEWLIRDNNIANEQISKEKNDINICSKLVSVRCKAPYYRNGGKNSSVNFNLPNYRTFSSSLRLNSAYVSCRKNSIICK